MCGLVPFFHLAFLPRTFPPFPWFYIDPPSTVFTFLKLHQSAPSYSRASVHRLTSSSIQLSAAINVQMVDVQLRSRPLQPSAFWRACGTIEDGILSSITFKTLQRSAESLLLCLWAWLFVSSVDLVMILVTDQSPLAEIRGHSGSQKRCSEEFDVCTPICNGSCPLVAPSNSTVSMSRGLAVTQSTGQSISCQAISLLGP